MRPAPATASLAVVGPTSSPPTASRSRSVAPGRPGTSDEQDRHATLRAGLLDWYAVTGRDLPWRHDRDPYGVLVSELMLQQTQVARVVEAWPRFLGRFPDVASLAGAPAGRVIAEWHGLGYNRRAVHLQRAAQAIMEHHQGVVPSRLADLQALPGVGPYTARAIAVFAFDQVAAPVDTNIARVLSRALVGQRLAPKSMQQWADAVVPPERPAAWSHALMDLGAQLCTARAPRCAACPVAATCAWQLSGHAEPDPADRGNRVGQGRFEGSDRWHRGRIVEALRRGPVPADALARAAGLERQPARFERLVANLVEDGLAEWDDERLRLPGSDDV